jgi:hypothetical protein
MSPGFHFALKSLPSSTPGLELSFATFIAILGFNNYARRVRADGEMLVVFGPRYQEK